MAGACPCRHQDLGAADQHPAGAGGQGQGHLPEQVRRVLPVSEQHQVRDVHRHADPLQLRAHRPGGLVAGRRGERGVRGHRALLRGDLLPRVVPPDPGLRLGLGLRAAERGGHVPGLRHRRAAQVDLRAHGRGGRGLPADPHGLAGPPPGPHRADRSADAAVQGAVDADPGPCAVRQASGVDGGDCIDDLVHLRHRSHGTGRPAGAVQRGRAGPGALRRPAALHVHPVPADDHGHVGL
mmetsp:Transcript_34835/g.105245  ORF Transcript_34835/g.105245 Transcript_34835/m.105245 type:complete len:238 (+) Transcript_34835:223-936(+)